MVHGLLQRKTRRQVVLVPLTMVWFVFLYLTSPLIRVTGEIAWLFQPNFNNFQHYHLGFIVNHQYRLYNNASMAKRIVRTTCPNPFSCVAGVAPPGHVCVTVTGHNRGSGIQHHIIPATYLKPTHPSAKNQVCVVVKGPCSGEVVSIKQCRKNARKIIAHDDTEMSFDDVCLAFQSTL